MATSPSKLNKVCLRAYELETKLAALKMAADQFRRDQSPGSADNIFNLGGIINEIGGDLEEACDWFGPDSRKEWGESSCP